MSSSTIAEVVEGGARTVREVSAACGAATDCTKCTVTVRQLIVRHAPASHQEDEPR